MRLTVAGLTDYSLDQHPHFACCDHANRSVLSLCTGPDTTLYGCRVYSWTISRRMASRGEVVLSLGNTLFNIRAQCCKSKTRQNNDLLMERRRWVVPFLSTWGAVNEQKQKTRPKNWGPKDPKS